ncbi:hemolysin family protein [Xylanibacter caecicola]|uniref:hemolysin family protein n=1 Tax=Xylanibacter caecicola TaxID=2736294 RepID=UPI002584B7EB|nr:hemolysin family protein [Xylanibacter caecicola]
MSEIFIIAGLIVLNGVFAMAEIALISARKSNLSCDADKGNKMAGIALKLTKDPDRFLSTIQIGITLIGILTGIYSGNKIAADFSDFLAGAGIPVRYASLVAQTVIVVVVTYLTIIFGELLPKRIGMAKSEQAAKLLSLPMYVLSRAGAPFVWLLSKSTSLVFGLLGLRDGGSKVTEDEIKSIVKEGAEVGEVTPVEQDIVQRVFQVGDLKIDSIMTHRSDITWLNMSMNAEEIREAVSNNIHSVYPVVENDLDDVKGVVSMSDMFVSLHKDDFKLSDIMRKPQFFYENMDVYSVLEIMKKEQNCYGLVCDEFGACQGMVTLKDILECLVGSIIETSDDEPSIIPRTEGMEWFVDGQCSMYDFLDYFGEMDLLENTDYNTVAGLCFHVLEHIPVCGESFTWQTFRFEIVDMDGARIDKLFVTRVEQIP